MSQDDHLTKMVSSYLLSKQLNKEHQESSGAAKECGLAACIFADR
jgi:hypothetical protein